MKLLGNESVAKNTLNATATTREHFSMVTKKTVVKNIYLVKVVFLLLGFVASLPVMTQTAVIDSGSSTVETMEAIVGVGIDTSHIDNGSHRGVMVAQRNNLLTGNDSSELRDDFFTDINIPAIFSMFDLRYGNNFEGNAANKMPSQAQISGAISVSPFVCSSADHFYVTEDWGTGQVTENIITASYMQMNYESECGLDTLSNLEDYALRGDPTLLAHETTHVEVSTESYCSESRYVAIDYVQKNPDLLKGIINFNIPRQRADLSLIEFAEQANITLIFPFDSAVYVTTNALTGEHSIEEAINLLLTDTRLLVSVEDEGPMILAKGLLLKSIH